jgi:hypothetical protein
MSNSTLITVGLRFSLLRGRRMYDRDDVPAR